MSTPRATRPATPPATPRAATAIAAALLLAACTTPAPTATRPAQTPRQHHPAPPTTVVIERTPWTFAGNRGNTIRTPHYRIFTTASNTVLLDRVPAFLEQTIEHYRTAALEDPSIPLPLPARSLDTYFMDSRPQWEAITTRILGERRNAALNIQRGGFATRGIGVYYDIGLADTLAVAAHEGWHQYTQRTFRHRLPTTLEEGLATYMEGHTWHDGRARFKPWANLARYDQLRNAAAQERLLSLEELTASSPSHLAAFGDDRLLTYYAQAWALTHYLKLHHPRALDAILRDAAEGRLNRRTNHALRELPPERRPTNHAAAVLAAYAAIPEGITTAQLEQRLSSFTAQLIATGSRDRIAQGQRPVP